MLRYELRLYITVIEIGGVAMLFIIHKSVVMTSGVREHSSVVVQVIMAERQEDETGTEKQVES